MCRFGYFCTSNLFVVFISSSNTFVDIIEVVKGRATSSHHSLELISKQATLHKVTPWVSLLLDLHPLAPVKLHMPSCRPHHSAAR